MDTPTASWGTYLYNGRIRPLAHDMNLIIPHLLILNGQVVHASPEEAPLGLDFRAADFSRVRSQNQGRIDFVDLNGKAVLPGLCDAHVHFLWWSDSLREVDLSRTHSLEEALETVRRSVARVGKADAQHTWLSGHGWSHNTWGEGQLPTAGQLDSVTGTIPTILKSKCGHLAWLNSAALTLTGIAGAVSPPGGEIIRDSLGDPTGILAENAITLATDHIPNLSRDQQRRNFLRGQAEAHSLGITSMHTPESVEHFGRYQEYREQSELNLRINFLMPAAQLPAMKDLALTQGLGDDHLRIAGTKLFADGSLGGRTALMYEPYENDGVNTGIVVSDEEEILQTTQASQALGIPMVIHAIGDRAVGNVLRAYREAHLQRDADGWPRLPHRIEHLQVLHPGDLDLLTEVCPVASVQPVHLCADIPAIKRWWGQARGELAYAFHTIREVGCPLIFGSDAPVEPISPWYGIYGAVTRDPLDHQTIEGFHRGQRLSVADCLEAYTAGPARAVGTWPRIGNLLPGALADFALYGEDPYDLSPQGWLDLRAEATYVGGKCVWTRDAGGVKA